MDIFSSDFYSDFGAILGVTYYPSTLQRSSTLKVKNNSCRIYKANGGIPEIEILKKGK